MIMENFINLLSDVWNRGFYGVNLSDIIISLVVLLAAFLLRGFIIATVLNAIGRLAAKTESKVDDEISLDNMKLKVAVADKRKIKKIGISIFPE